MSIIFPRPLPPLTKESEIDPTGFTKMEKNTLRNTWRVIKRHQRQHAKDVFLGLYTEHDYLLEFFRNSNGVLNMHALHHHPGAVLRVYDRLISEGLDDQQVIHVIMSEVVEKHSKFLGFKDALDAFEKQTDMCERHAINILKDVSSPTFIISMKKLSALIRSYLIVGFDE